MKIGIIGGGNISQFLLKAINNDGLLEGSRVEAVFTRRAEVAKKLEERFSVTGYTAINPFLKADVDIIVEAATMEAVNDYGLQVLASGRHLVISSVGAMVNPAFAEELKRISQQKGVEVLLPSGAIGGLDAIKSAKALGQLAHVELVTRKPPTALPAAEQDIASEVILFEGTAADAISRFPRNINVGVVLALAGVGADKTIVKIVADPAVQKNSHTINAIGTFGKLQMIIENEPMPGNPKTSYLAALSVLATLQNREQSVVIG